MGMAKTPSTGPPNAGEGVEQRALSLVAAGTQNGAGALEDCLVVSCKTRDILTVKSSNATPWHLPEGVENVCPYQNLHVDVYSSFVHNYQNL